MIAPRLPLEAKRNNPTPACLPASTCHVLITLHTNSGFRLSIRGGLFRGFPDV